MTGPDRRYDLHDQVQKLGQQESVPTSSLDWREVASEFGYDHLPPEMRSECCQRMAAEISHLRSDYQGAMNCCEMLTKERAYSEKLREALEFYADKSNWVSRTGRVGTSPIDTEDRETNPDGTFPWAGGKRAREALALKPPGEEK